MHGRVKQPAPIRSAAGLALVASAFPQFFPAHSFLYVFFCTLFFSNFPRYLCEFFARQCEAAPGMGTGSVFMLRKSKIRYLQIAVPVPAASHFYPLAVLWFFVFFFLLAACRLPLCGVFLLKGFMSTAIFYGLQVATFQHHKPETMYEKRDNFYVIL